WCWRKTAIQGYSGSARPRSKPYAIPEALRLRLQQAAITRGIGQSGTARGMRSSGSECLKPTPSQDRQPWSWGGRSCRRAQRHRAHLVLKGGREPWQHQVPLSDQALALLRTLLVNDAPPTEYVFPSRGGRKYLGTSAMLDLLRRIGWNERTTTHGI